jgi:hypothetical protein
MRSLFTMFGKKKNTSGRPARRFRPTLDTLEDRQLMSSSPLALNLPDLALRPGEQKTVELPTVEAAQDAVPGLVQKAFELDQRLGLNFSGTYHTDWLGDGEKWLLGSASQWYYLRPNGELWQWHNSTPGHAAQTPDVKIDVLDASFHADPRKLFDAEEPAAAGYAARVTGLAAHAYELDQQLGLRFTGNYSTNWLGAGEKWMLGNNSQWYFITPAGALHRWNGKTGTPAQAGTLVSTLDGSFHADPRLLHDAVQPPAQVSITGNQLTITTAKGFVGDFTIEVSTSDGFASTTQAFVVQVINTAPTLDLADQHIQSGAPTTLTLPATDADGDTITYTARIASPAARAYELDQQLGLRFTGNYSTNWLGAGEKWMLDSGNRWYFITPAGDLYHWNGKRSAPAQSGSVVEALDSSFHADPRRLHDAAQPTMSVVVAGNQLTITAVENFTSTFRVEVTASDGLASTRQSFAVRTPLTSAIADQAMAANTSLSVALPVVGLASGETTVEVATRPDPLVALKQQHNLMLAIDPDGTPNLREDQLGLGEKWLTNDRGEWFYILPSGDFHQQGVAAAIANVGAAVHADPSRLWDARLLEISYTLDGDVLTITPPANFVGSFEVEVTASRGAAETEVQTFTVQVGGQEAELADDQVNMPRQTDQVADNSPQQSSGVPSALVVYSGHGSTELCWTYIVDVYSNGKWTVHGGRYPTYERAYGEALQAKALGSTIAGLYNVCTNQFIPLHEDGYQPGEPDGPSQQYIDQIKNAYARARDARIWATQNVSKLTTKTFDEINGLIRQYNKDLGDARSQYPSFDTFKQLPTVAELTIEIYYRLKPAYGGGSWKFLASTTSAAQAAAWWSELHAKYGHKYDFGTKVR